MPDAYGVGTRDDDGIMFTAPNSDSVHYETDPIAVDSQSNAGFALPSHRYRWHGGIESPGSQFDVVPASESVVTAMLQEVF